MGLRRRKKGGEGEALKKLVPLILLYWKMPPERKYCTYCTVQYPKIKGDKTPDIIQRNFTIQHNRSGRNGPGALRVVKEVLLK